MVSWEERAFDLSAEALLAPLREAFLVVRENLRKRHGYRSELNAYWGTMQGLTVAADQTLRAVLLLVADERLKDPRGPGQTAFPGQAMMLGRSLLEALANVMALSEEPKSRDLLFRQDGYRERFRRLETLRRKNAAKPHWQDSLRAEEEDLASQAGILRLSPEEKDNPEGTLRSWPRPNGLLKGTDRYGRSWLTGTRLDVLTLLEEDSYGPYSRIVHQKDAALYFARVQERGLTLRELEVVRNVLVFRGVTMHTAILTEVDTALEWPSDAKRQLRSGWAVLTPAFDPAAEIYQVRYRHIL